MKKQDCTVGESIESNSKFSDRFEKNDMLIREWEEARCPVCLEHPHNAVLLKCSSYANGCRPFMCNTSSHHSNCLDQFLKSPVPSTSNHSIRQISCGETDSKLDQKLICPLCRGNVLEWYVIEPAREFMNSKARSCSTEACDFIGTYMELRKHARAEHPTVQPSAVDPVRQRNWTRLESETHISDLLTFLPSMNHLGVNSNAELDDGVMILEQNDAEPDIAERVIHNTISFTIDFVAFNSVAMLDDTLCLDSVSPYADWRRPSNYSRGNSVARLPQHYVRNNLRGRNNNYILRQNNGFYPRNNRDGRYNNVNNNLNPRQNNSFRGNNTQRMRDTRRLNSTAQNNNWRNGYDTRPNASR